MHTVITVPLFSTICFLLYRGAHLPSHMADLLVSALGRACSPTCGSSGRHRLRRPCTVHCPSDRTHTFMHSPCENDHQPPRQPLMEAGDWRSCLCLNSSHGRVPRVETVIVLLQKHLGNGRGPGSSILITSCDSQCGRSRRATTLAAQSL